MVKQLPELVSKVVKKRIEIIKIRGKQCKLNKECWELQDLFKKELIEFKTRISNIQ
jgi:hypothetical protein